MSGPTFRKSHNIETQRLAIRSATPEDAQGIAALRGNPVNNPFEGADSGDPEEYLRRMVNWRKAHDDGRYAFTVILRRSDSSSSAAGDVKGEGELVGFGGFNEFRWIDSRGAKATRCSKSTSEPRLTTSIGARATDVKLSSA